MFQTINNQLIEQPIYEEKWETLENIASRVINLKKETLKAQNHSSLQQLVMIRSIKKVNDKSREKKWQNQAEVRKYFQWTVCKKTTNPGIAKIYSFR